MAIYKCSICGYEFDEEKENKSFKELEKCPVCKHPASVFKKISDGGDGDKKESVNEISEGSDGDKKEAAFSSSQLEYPKETARFDSSIPHMADIHEMAVNGNSIINAMATEIPMPSWDEILIIANQLNPFPLDEHAEVKTRTIIGKNARKPMVLESPIYISHMSFGALSYESKIALAKGSAMAKTAMSSGEGGILADEMENSYKYIFEYVPNHYSLTKENLVNSDAIEIKIGQGTKPGMGGHLPAKKISEEIAAIRGKPMGEDIISPSLYEEIKSKEDLKDLISHLREESEGRPIGVKIAAGRIEEDLEFISYAEPDFITIDGRGGATGASPKIIRDATSIPTIYALSRARKYLDDNNIDIDLIITGGLRVSSDFAKALSLGADAIAVATSALMAIGCQQYRICGSGNCPVGITTQDENLRKRMDIDIASQRVYNYLNVSLEEIKTFARITGHEDIHDLSLDNLTTFNSEISDYTDIPHV
ncbi:glutamate synthase-related protein [Methanobrevibacter olleyae]|uniref:Archaeal glutamate synthase [NADPH] n=1 Tax=Methanobrevibacter olleyae TaxID=294671 RepID=A0A126QZ50_METOL|nr:glutamate synthase-related protein [Methanobrevibacter olleyae]AMK14959.1 glutamate synthase domain-containing protein [Methanobrevibacter olleyae]SFL65662.1 glutamate synthase conserved region-containing protein [Methanobrevibacter olleyae]